MKIGDKVAVLDDDISGLITAVKGDTITLLTEEDFEIEYSKNEIVIINELVEKEEFIPDDIDRVIAEKTEERNMPSKRVKPKERKLPPMVVDLHIQHLVENTKRLTNYDILTIQIETAKRQLDFAIRKKIQRIVFIHGVGEGVLRAELEYLFRQYGNLAHNDADFKKYGRGATEVYVFQNKKP